MSAVAATFASITNKQSDTHTHTCLHVCMYMHMYVCMHGHAGDCVRYMTMCCVRVYSTLHTHTRTHTHKYVNYKVCLSPATLQVSQYPHLGACLGMS